MIPETDNEEELKAALLAVLENDGVYWFAFACIWGWSNLLEKFQL
jgi:hypothetical protein